MYKELLPNYIRRTGTVESVKQGGPPFEAVMHEEIRRHVDDSEEEKEEEFDRLRHGA
jgi:hypothetical protein